MPKKWSKKEAIRCITELESPFGEQKQPAQSTMAEKIKQIAKRGK